MAATDDRMAPGYRRRFLDSYLDELASELPAFMLTGARGCGKTTTASQRTRTAVHLDDVGEAEAFRGQPDAYLAELEPPVLIDEWQEVPESLAAVKRAVDGSRSVGRFFITGSVRARHTGRSWPGTGRILPVRMYGMTRAEHLGHLTAATFVDDVFAGTIESRELATTTVFEYVDVASQGGFPDAMGLSARSRDAWFGGYVEQLVMRDTEALTEIREPGLLRDLLQIVALHTAKLISKESLARTTGANARTIERYLGVLEELGVLERLPNWDQRIMKGLAKAPKYHVTDTGLAMWLARATPDRVVTNADLLGQFIESLALAQIRPLLKLSHIQAEAHHFRDAKSNREVDLVLAAPSGEIVGIEIKASAQVTMADLRHLFWLRNQLGDRFAQGLVLYTGSRIRRLDDRMWAIPLAALWQW